MQARSGNRNYRKGNGFFGDLFGGSKVTYKPGATKSALSAAYKAGEKYGDTGEFDSWWNRYPSKSGVDKSKAKREFERGVEGEASTEKVVAKKAVGIRGKYRGCNLYFDPESKEYFSACDRDSKFDSYAEAKKHVDYVKDQLMRNPDYSEMDGSTKFRLISDLKRELHEESTSDERSKEILKEIRKIEKAGKPKKAKKTKKQYMVVMGGYVLDMFDHGKKIGYLDEYDNIRDNFGSKIDTATDDNTDFGSRRRNPDPTGLLALDSTFKGSEKYGKKLAGGVNKHLLNPKTSYRGKSVEELERIRIYVNARVYDNDWLVRDRARRELEEVDKALANARKREKKKNPDGKSPLEITEGFHGRPSEDMTEVIEEEHYSDELAGLGLLCELEVFDPNHEDKVIPIKFNYSKPEDTVILACDKNGNIEFVGGDQDLQLDDLESKFGTLQDGDGRPHSKVKLGYVHTISYFADKVHLEGPKYQAKGTEYIHTFGEEGGEEPCLIYDFRNKKMELVGGSYTITDEGIRN